MTRRGEKASVGVWEDEIRIGELVHLRLKSIYLDWVRGEHVGGSNAPSDLARSIVGDLLEDDQPAGKTYREVTLRLNRIPHAGGELTEEELLELIDQGAL